MLSTSTKQKNHIQFFFVPSKRTVLIAHEY